MKIKELEIKNFKSFGKKTTIPVLDGFTVISGPNGSGKSNIIDAIIFALGLSSSRALRAEKLTDLISSFNGTRKDYAEVTVVFDNTDGKIPVESDEVKITRRIKETESGYYSYYYINSTPATLSEIHGKLSYAGLYSDGYNVVMQGDVTRIIEMTPYERRKIIDDIAGISEFDAKKEQALKELEVVAERIERVSIILSEVEAQLEQLERDKEQAIRYRELKERREYLEKCRIAHEVREIQKRVDRVEGDIERLNQKKDKKSRELAEIRNELNILEKRAEELTRKIMEEGEETYRQLREEIQHIKTEIAGSKQRIEIFRKEIERLGGEKTKILVKINQERGELKKIEEEMNRYLIQRAGVESTINQLSGEALILKTKIGEMGKKYEEQKNRLFALKEKSERLKGEISSLIRERDVLLDSIRKRSVEVDEKRHELDAINYRLSEIQEEMEKQKERSGSLEVKLGDVLRERNEIDKKIFSLRNEISGLDKNIKEIEVKLASITAKLRAMEESAYGKAVETILKAKKERVLPGIYGIVAELGTVNDEFSTALSVAGGAGLQFIVVDTEDDAVRAIKYLKDRNAGRATFLPLSRLKEKFGRINLRKDVLKLDGVVDYAINLVSFEEKFRPVFNFIFRDTVVVEDIDSAKRILKERYDLRMVTLDGDLVEKSGAMTGGSRAKARYTFLSDFRQEIVKLEEELTILRNRRKNLINELNHVEEQRRRLQENADRIQNELYGVRKSIEILMTRREETLRTAGKIKDELRKFEEDREGVTERLKEIEMEIEKRVKEKSDVEREIRSVESSLKGSKIPAYAKKLEQLNSDIEANREMLRKIESRLESLGLNKKNLEEAIQERTGKVRSLEDEIEGLKARVEKEKESITRYESTLEERFEKEKELTENLKDLRDERDNVMKQITELEERKTTIQTEISVIEEKIRGKMELLENLKNEIDSEEFEMIEELPPLKEVERELVDVEREIEEMGDVNLKAIQEYHEVSKRRDELVEKRDVLSGERDGILERIERYESRKKEVFYETFNAINANFKEIFAKLSDGTGELILENPDNPFESGLYINVKPYGKPVQRLESMSGGEKSLVAISLIFAIQRYKPAPFYVFDEIDMFLDGVNVDRVAKLIRENSRNAQFIVVSLRKPMIEKADSIIGVTMRDNSTIVTGVRMN